MKYRLAGSRRECHEWLTRSDEDVEGVPLTQAVFGGRGKKEDVEQALGGVFATEDTTWSLPHTTGDYQTNPILCRPAWKIHF